MATSPSRWYALAALALGTLAVGLDATILSVALPTLSRDLEATTSDLQWFTDAYLLVLAAALLPAGMLGDRSGRKKFLLGALVVFGLASAACAYATTSGQLIAARAALGLGSAVIMPLSGAVLTVLFDQHERGKALSIWLTASALGIPLGPLLGGWLLDNFWWGAVFLINVPLMAGAFLAGTRTGVSSGYGFVAAWITAAGIGLGFTLPPSMDVAMGVLTVERSGVGNGLIQAMRQVGGAIGVAVLGTVLNGAYR